MGKVLILLTPSEAGLQPVRRNLPPLGLAQLQGYLRAHGVEVEAHDLTLALSRSAVRRRDWRCVLDKGFVLDALRGGPSLQEAAELLDPLLVDVDGSDLRAVGISMGGGFSLFEIHAGLLVGKLLASRGDAPVALGGTNVTYLYLFRDTYRELWDAIHPQFPYVFMGPGERSFLRLLEALDRGTAAAEYPLLRGAISREGGTVTAQVEDLSSLVCPDFAGLELEAYSTCTRANDPLRNEADFFRLPFPFNLHASERNRRLLTDGGKEEAVFLPYMFNHHCPYNCAFCEESSAHKRRPWSKDAAGAWADLRHLSGRHATEYFYFFDNAFNYTPAFAREFCTLARESGAKVRWSDCARVTGLTEPLLASMFEAGCRKLVFGLETASPRLLRYIDKRLDLDQFRQVLAWCHRIGIAADVEIIVGLPFEEEEDFQATYRFVEDNLSFINCFALNRYFVVPPSLMGAHPDRYGIRIVPGRSYDEVLRTTAEALAGGGPPTGELSFHLLAYDEVGGRSHRQVAAATADKYERMFQLWWQLPVVRRWVEGQAL